MRRDSKNDAALAEIIRRAQHGDAQAYDVLVRQFQDRAVGYACTLLPDYAAAQDAAQEAFVQAWRDLPGLAEPLAFGAWLRRIVFKYCDRARRSCRATVPLSELLLAPLGDTPQAQAEQAETARELHTALARLTAPLHAVTHLYYLAGYSVAEIADRLETPPQTVKNRLFAARKQLRKDLQPMTIPTVSAASDNFADAVLSRVLREYQGQMRTDPHTANRALLTQARTALNTAATAPAPMSYTAACAGLSLLWEQWDFAAMATHLMRFLAAPRPDSETAWAYLHLANALAMTGSPAGAVLAHEAFERLQHKQLCLQQNHPYNAAENAATNTYDANETRLLFLSQSGEFASAYHGAGRGTDYFRKLDAALSAVPPTGGNRHLRFTGLRMGCAAGITTQDHDAAKRYVAPMYRLADEEEDAAQKTHWQIKALGDDTNLARAMGDEAGFADRTRRAVELLNAASAHDAAGQDWLPGERHNLAHQLTMAGDHAAALPLWEANAASGGQFGGWGWLLYAATVWKTSGDRERTLALLRDAAVHDARDLTPLFVDRPEFAGVHSNPDFVDAVRRPAVHTETF